MKYDRTAAAADLMRIDREKVQDVHAEVQRRVRAMTEAERQDLTSRIDACIEWADAYEAEWQRLNLQDKAA